MTYADLLSAIYTQFDALRDVWENERTTGEGIGAFAFLPEGYVHARRFDETKYEFWSIEHVQDYLSGRGNTDESYRELVDSLTYGEEFLVLIVEEEAVNLRFPVHIHRITRVGQN
jgi:hypothetical protein